MNARRVTFGTEVVRHVQCAAYSGIAPLLLALAACADDMPNSASPDVAPIASASQTRLPDGVSMFCTRGEQQQISAFIDGARGVSQDVTVRRAVQLAQVLSPSCQDALQGPCTPPQIRASQQRQIATGDVVNCHLFPQ